MKRYQTSAHCLLSPGSSSQINERILQLQLFLSFEQATTGPWKLQLDDRETGNRMPALKPVFQAQGPEKARMFFGLESDLAFIDICIPGSVTMIVMFLRNNLIHLAFPVSSPARASQIRGSMMYRRIFEHGRD